eukprot:TRINITY_DN258_c0_g1_i1.p1 TRINITY_DN258_c0_g1~~TRINITY_DN258_c0_g1_i1.p1  ORF type:complete len:500 (-),score=139.27 TRINITY_DN258_c0_g1_i1:108-1607(-)
MASTKKISMSEVVKHNHEKDCWLVIHGKVYDLTSFLSDHPGGSKIILKQAGRDATTAFSAVHNKDIISQLPASAFIGELDPLSVTEVNSKANAEPDEAEAKAVVLSNIKPSIEHMLNVFDFEAVAQQVMTKEGWDYYCSGADDEITLRENRAAFQRIWLKPRVLVNVKEIDVRTTLLGTPSALPIYITATAMGKLANPEGEVVLTRAAHSQGIIQMCPTLASCSLEEMLEAKKPGQTQWFQLYVNPNRKLTYDLIKRAEKGGCKALAITVDAPQLGRRERDMRNKVTASSNLQKDDKTVDRSKGIAQALSSFIDPSLNWDDIKWFKSVTSMDIILKGIQCGEDAVLAVEHGVQGIIVSNHGGRQLDCARSAIEILPEVMDALKARGYQNKIEVFIDGGIRRGSDILKALALGAKAVGIGRPMLYAMAAFGQEGVERALQLLTQELKMAMSLCGTPTIAQITPDIAITRNLNDHFIPTPRDHLSETNYLPLRPAVIRSNL